MTRVTLELNMSAESALIIIRALVEVFKVKLINVEVHDVPSKQ